MMAFVYHNDQVEGRISADLDPNKQPEKEAAMSKKDLPSPEYLRQRLRYDADTGRLIWKFYEPMPAQWNRRFANTEAGGIKRNYGYRDVRIDYALHKAHQIIWAIHYDEWPSGEIDHIDGNGLNNSLSNLRDVSHNENLRNQARAKNNSSGVTGVVWNKQCGKWMAQIVADGTRHYLGLFVKFDDAVAARKSAEASYGFHSNHGRTTIVAKQISC